jgi:hypothetical protein
VTMFKGITIFQPVMNGAGGNLVAIQVQPPPFLDLMPCGYETIGYCNVAYEPRVVEAVCKHPPTAAFRVK